MTTELKLFVYVIGIAGSSFPIDIEQSKTVGDLKKAIKDEKPNVLQGVDADQLTLFKVELPDDDEALGRIVPRDFDNQTKLKPSRELSKVFKEQPPAETVSIVVTPPDGFGKGGE